MSQSSRKDDNNRGGSRGNFNNNNNMNNNNPNNKRGGSMVNEEGWSTQQSKNNRPVPLDFNKMAPVSSGGTEVRKLGAATMFQNFMAGGNCFNVLNEENEEKKDQQSNDGNRNQYGGRFSAGRDSPQNQNNRGGNGGGYMNNNNNNNNRKGVNVNNVYNRTTAGSRSLQPPTSPQNQQNKQFGNSSRNNNSSNNNNNSNNNRYQNNNSSSNNNSNSFRSDPPMKSNTLPRKQSAPARPQTETAGLQKTKEKTVTKTDVIIEIKKKLGLFESEELTVGAAVEKLQVCKIDENVLVDIYTWGFEQHDKTRFMLTEMVCEGVSRQLILTADLLSALEKIYGEASDLSIDLPLYYTYMGQYLALPLLKRIIYVKDWLKILDSEIKANKGGVNLKQTFTTFENKYGKDSLCQLYDEANINFQQLLGENDKLEEFLKENVSTLNKC